MLSVALSCGIGFTTAVFLDIRLWYSLRVSRHLLLIIGIRRFRRVFIFVVSLGLDCVLGTCCCW